jgi:spermidine synthase
LEDIINGYYTAPTQKEFLDKCNQVLNDNGIFTLEHWRKLTEENKDKDGYPRGLRMLLDEASQGNNPNS